LPTTLTISVDLGACLFALSSSVEAQRDSVRITDWFRRAETYVDKILKGKLIINLKAAKQIGLTIPPTCWRGRIK